MYTAENNVHSVEYVLPIYDKNFNFIVSAMCTKSKLTAERIQAPINDFEPAAEELVKDYLNVVQYESGNFDTSIEIYEIQNMLGDLAELVVSKNPNQAEAEQLKTLDELWQSHRESHNYGLQDQIQAMEILLQNEIFEYENGNPTASGSRISYYKSEIAKLYKKMI